MGGFATGGLLSINAPSARNVVSPYAVNGRPYGVATLPNGSGRFGTGQVCGIASTTFGLCGINNINVTGTASAQPALTSATRMHVQYAAAATNGTVAGIIPLASGNWSANTKPMLGVGFRWPAEATLRMWIGLAESTLGSTAVATSSVSSNDHACIGFDAAVASTWLGSTCDGTNQTAAALVGGGAETPISAHEYVVLIDPRTEAGTACTFHLWDITAGTYATLRKTTNVLRTLSSVSFGYQASVTTLEDVAKNMQISGFYSVWN